MKLKKWICLCLSVIAVVTFAGCGKAATKISIPQSSYAAYDMTKYGNTPANLQNGGTFVEKNGKIFYNNGLVKNALYVYDTATSTHTKLSDLKATNLNADAQYLYFIDSSNRMHKMKQDGTSDQILLEGAYTNSLALYDGIIYFTNRTSNICSCNTDGSNMKKLTVFSGSNMQIYEGKIYFCNDTMNICRLDSNGSFTKIGDVAAGHFFINNNFIYFTDSTAGYPGKYTLDGTKGVLYTNIMCDNLNITSDNKLYYRDVQTGALMYREVNTQGYYTASSDKCDQVSVLNDKVYYINTALLNTPRVVEKDSKLATDFYS